MEVIAWSQFSGTNGDKFHLDLGYELLSQDRATNSSKIRLYCLIRSFGYAGSGSNCNGFINDEWVGSFSSIAANEYKTVGTKEITIQHDASGNASYGASARINTPWTLGSASCNATISLPKIIRNATLTSGADITVQGLKTKQQLSINNPANFSLYLEYIINGTIKFSKELGQVSSAIITFTQKEVEELLKTTSYTLRLVAKNISHSDYSGAITRRGIMRTTKNILIPYYNDGSGAKMCTAFIGNREGV